MGTTNNKTITLCLLILTFLPTPHIRLFLPLRLTSTLRTPLHCCEHGHAERSLADGEGPCPEHRLHTKQHSRHYAPERKGIHARRRQETETLLRATQKKECSSAGSVVRLFQRSNDSNFANLLCPFLRGVQRGGIQTQEPQRESGSIQVNVPHHYRKEEYLRGRT